MFRRKWLPIWISLIILPCMGYYGYVTNEEVVINGRYSIGTIVKTKYARSGIRTWWTYNFKGQTFQSDGISPFDIVGINDVGKRVFVQFLPNKPKEFNPLYYHGEVPDSIHSAPDTGWSRGWMMDHFPNVVER